jgi:hypothetical protein
LGRTGMRRPGMRRAGILQSGLDGDRTELRGRE